MKNLRITKIITALIVTIWMPSSFADSTYPLNVKIINGTRQVNFVFNVDEAPDKVKLCLQSDDTCRVFKKHPTDKNFWTKYAEDSKKSNGELFIKLLKDSITRQPLTAEKNVDFMLMSITSTLRHLTTIKTLNSIGYVDSSVKEIPMFLYTVADISMTSPFLTMYRMSWRVDFYNYLSKLRIITRIVIDNTNTHALNRQIRIDVEDKVMEDFIKKLEEEFTEIKRTSEGKSTTGRPVPFLSIY